MGGLGDLVKNNDCVFVPVVVEYFKERNIVITQIQCGDHHTLCFDAKGVVYAHGNNEHGQVGCSEKKYESFVSLPTKCVLPNNGKSRVIVDIDVGAYHSLLLSADNQIYSFGNNDCNQCSTLLNHKKIHAPHWLNQKTEIKCLGD